ncbi:hypothetical protein ACC757_23730 [Rhizobium ruizarguesonis]
MLLPILLTEMTDEQRTAWPLDEDRQQPWNKSLYSASRWIVVDDRILPNSKEVIINFEMPVAGGKLLTDHQSLYQAAKEFAFWVRASDDSGLADAQTHASIVREFCTLCCALTHRGVFSFAELTRQQHKSLVIDWEYGHERLLGCAEKVRDYLSCFSDRSEIPPHLLGSEGSTVRLKRKEVLAACGFQDVTGLMRTVWEFDAAERRLGFFVRKRRAANLTAEPPTDRKTTSSTYHKRQWLFRFMYEQRFVLQCQCLSFQPRDEERGRTYRKGGVASKPTPVAPPSLVFKMIRASGEVVKAEGKSLVGEFKSAKAAKLTSASSAPKAQLRRSLTERGLLFAGAVWSLAATFTFRRPEELALLRRDCLAGSDETGWWLNVFIVKNLKDWVWLPIPPEVAKAIEILISLSPKLPSTAPLFTVQCLETGIVRKLNASKWLGKFSRRTETVEYRAENDKVGLWKWSPRQFRRFGAVLHFWGYGGSIAVTSWVLRHFNLYQSWGYTHLDRELEREFAEVKAEFTRYIANEAIAGKLGGPLGKRLVKDALTLAERRKALDENFGKITIIDPERMTTALIEVMRRNLLVLVPRGWVICGCPETEKGAANAMCRKQEGEGTKRMIGSDFTKAAPSVCAGCFWAITDEQTRSCASQDMEDLALSVVSPDRIGTIFGERQSAQLARFVQFERKSGFQLDSEDGAGLSA